jgi:hypothetical protein
MSKIWDLAMKVTTKNWTFVCPSSIFKPVIPLLSSSSSNAHYHLWVLFRTKKKSQKIFSFGHVFIIFFPE